MPKTMNPAVAHVELMFSINDQLLNQSLQGLTEDELWRAPSSHNNPLLWVAGHVVQTRAMVLQMLGTNFETGWGNLFDRGAAIRDRREYPAGSKIAEVINQINPKLHEAFENVDDERLNTPATYPIPGVNTFADELAFFALHDSYHVGQLSYIRKSLGYPGLAD